ncbi:MAG: YabP/YqfC family sporulation protein [Oscillospiraceae bacterium]|nr:YabP/YqfC family sporulation protein [Oscillospiraceae bacterium]
MQEERSFKQPHQLILEERGRLSVSGVQDVDCFDESLVILFTSLGRLVIRGSSLRVSSFSNETGDFALEGQVDSLAYSEDQKAGGGFFRGLFR